MPPRKRKIETREPRGLYDDRTNYIDKDLERSKKAKVYTTELINEIIEQYTTGDPDADMMPFFHGQIVYKNSGITFEYTEKEWEELEKCSEDPEYFIETYCTFLTDYGRKTVTLRPYQKDVIHLMCDEHYDEKLDLFVANNRRVCLL